MNEGKSAATAKGRTDNSGNTTHHQDQGYRFGSGYGFIGKDNTTQPQDDHKTTTKNRKDKTRHDKSKTKTKQDKTKNGGLSCVLILIAGIRCFDLCLLLSLSGSDLVFHHAFDLVFDL